MSSGAELDVGSACALPAKLNSIGQGSQAVEFSASFAKHGSNSPACNGISSADSLLNSAKSASSSRRESAQFAAARSSYSR